MDPKQIAKQLIDFNKTAFDNSFTAISVLQDQSEKMINTYFDQSPWFPEEGKKLLKEWLSAYKNGRNNVKNAADENFKKLEDYFAGMETGGKAKSGK